MKKLVCWMMTLALLLGCVCGLAETADGNEETSYLQITGSAPVPVYEKVTDTEKADELQPGQLCGLMDDITTEVGVRWYQIVYLNKLNKGAVGYVRTEYAHRLTLAEFNALAEDPAKANEAMDLLSAVDALMKADSGISETMASGTGDTSAEAEEGKSAKAETDLFREFYASAMKALDQVFNMDITGAINEVTNQARNIAGKAVDAGLNILDSAMGGAKNLITALSSDAANKIAAATPVLEAKLGAVVDAAEDGIGTIGDKAKKGIGTIAGLAEDGIGTIRDKAKEGIGEIAEQAKDGFGSIAGKAIGAAGEIRDTAKEEIAAAAPGEMTKDLKELLQGMKNKISSLENTAESSLGTWVDEINNLYDEDPVSGSTDSGDETLTQKLERLKNNLGKSASGVATVVQATSEKIEKDGLLEFASQLLNTIRLNDVDQLTDFFTPGTTGGSN